MSEAQFDVLLRQIECLFDAAEAGHFPKVEE
jgi:hypothetical protein